MTPRLSLTDRSTCDQAPPYLYQPGRLLPTSFALSSRGRLQQALSAHPDLLISFNCSTGGPSLDSGTERDISGGIVLSDNF